MLTPNAAEVQSLGKSECAFLCWPNSPSSHVIFMLNILWNTANESSSVVEKINNMCAHTHTHLTLGVLGCWWLVKEECCKKYINCLRVITLQQETFYVFLFSFFFFLLNKGESVYSNSDKFCNTSLKWSNPGHSREPIC